MKAAAVSGGGGRWSDLVDMAALMTGNPYPAWHEVAWLLWEQTPFPLGTTDEVFAALLAYYGDEPRTPAPR